MRKKKFACGWPTLVLSLLLLGTLMSAAMAAPAVQGQWSTLTNLAPINPIHAALLPNGKVLIIAGSGNCPPSQPGCPAGAPYNPTTTVPAPSSMIRLRKLSFPSRFHMTRGAMEWWFYPVGAR